MMRKTFKFFNIKLFKIICPTFIRTHLEFASSVWNSMTKGDIKKIEGIQKRATKMVIELRGMEYEERLEALGLTTLDIRRKRGDMIQIYKIMKGVETVGINMEPDKSYKNIERRHRHQISRDKFVNTPMRDGFLPNRSATTWNLLPPEIAEAETVNSFKARIDRHMKSDSWRRSVYRV